MSDTIGIRFDRLADAFEFVDLGSLSTTEVEPPPNHEPDTELGSALAKIWRDNYETGVGFEKAVVTNWTYMGPILHGFLSDPRYAAASGVSIWAAARIALREYFVSRLTLRPLITKIGIGGGKFGCKIIVGTNPGATLLRWLDHPGMAPGIPQGPSLLEELKTPPCIAQDASLAGIDVTDPGIDESLMGK